MSGDKAASPAASDRRNGPAAGARRRAIVFAGPTASGKSAAALAAAREFGGTIVNADSMQVYRELPILSAAPDAAARAAAPHRLYGVLSAAEACSAARWRALALAEIDVAGDAGALPILAGGTGLYLDALRHGLAAVPDIPPPVRAAGKAIVEAEGAAALHARLAALDPAGAAALRATDRQRVLRAWEVVAATGRPLREWQREMVSPDDGPETLCFVFLPPRESLYAACNVRFEAMVAEGAIAEVEALLASGLDPDLPAMKALGVREIAAFLRGEIDRARMIALGQQATRRYAKRQYTWFRHRMRDAVVFPAQFSAKMTQEIFAKIRTFGLTA